MMKRIIWLFLFALALPMTSFATAVEFTNSGGTLSGNSTGLTLTGSTLTDVGGITGDLGSVTFRTNGLSSGNLQMGGTFLGGGILTITGNGMNGVHNGVIFTGTFTVPEVTWTLVTLANGTHDYQLEGTLIGSDFTGATVFGTTTELTVNVGKGFFGRAVTLDKGDTTIDTNAVPVVPEPGSLTLFGTGLLALAGVGVVRRKLKA